MTSFRKRVSLRVLHKAQRKARESSMDNTLNERIFKQKLVCRLKWSRSFSLCNQIYWNWSRNAQINKPFWFVNCSYLSQKLVCRLKWSRSFSLCNQIYWNWSRNARTNKPFRFVNCSDLSSRPVLVSVTNRNDFRGFSMIKWKISNQSLPKLTHRKLHPFYRGRYKNFDEIRPINTNLGESNIPPNMLCFSRVTIDKSERF